MQLRIGEMLSRWQSSNFEVNFEKMNNYNPMDLWELINKSALSLGSRRDKKPQILQRENFTFCWLHDIVIHSGLRCFGLISRIEVQVFL